MLVHDPKLELLIISHFDQNSLISPVVTDFIL